jgi:hypothetical protein
METNAILIPVVGWLCLQAFQNKQQIAVLQKVQGTIEEDVKELKNLVLEIKDSVTLLLAKEG